MEVGDNAEQCHTPIDFVVLLFTFSGERLTYSFNTTPAVFLSKSISLSVSHTINAILKARKSMAEQSEEV
jgi:hypothetical protein